MMAGAADKLGIALVVQTPHAGDPAVKIAAEVLLAPIDDAQATAQLATRCQVITFENEFINLEALRSLAQQGVCFRPSLEALSPLLDKYQQRCYLQEIGLPVPRFLALEANPSPSQVLDSPFGFPAVLKSRRHGYDGQGTFIVRDRQSLESIWHRWQHPSFLLEELIPFERELAVIAARSVTGEVAIYPVVETQQQDQVCRWVLAPAHIPAAMTSEIERMARHLLEQLKFVGVLGIELFLTPEGRLLVNEIAPRTHNSGHYTLDACETSQFEMHLRAVAGLPWRSPALKAAGAVMVNLLGYEHSYHDYGEKRAAIAALPHAHVHWYGKTESRPGRKLGHVTVLSERDSLVLTPADREQKLLQTARTIESLWYNR
jgi:5-(carboxyamino)imidazole ribonucleotide synthase